MMVALDQAGAQHSQSPVGADMRDGDGTSMLFRVPEALVNIAHIQKINHWQTRPAMSVPGQTRKSGDAITTSALPPTADIQESGCDVR